MVAPLLQTKLFAPAPDPNVLLRPRLLDGLAGSGEAGLVLVSAPAGSGKTVLVASWLAQAGVPFGWVSLDERDNDPAAFLRYLLGALQPLRNGAGGLARRLLDSPTPPDPHALLGALINDLVEHEDAGVLVLDDYHVIEHPEVHVLLRTLVERLPPALTLVLITRSDPPLPLARMRAGGRLLEVRAGDLQFREEEAAELVERFGHRRLDGPSVAALTRRTEGWAAGLQLASLALRSAPDPDAFIARFEGTHTFVADYLADEVLDGLSEDQKDFLIRTALLARLTGPLCDAVLGRSDSGRVLEELLRANLFLIPLDARREWFRYHHLFADLLRKRCAALLDGDRASLLARASVWAEENGLVDEAVRYALEAGDAERAARLTAAHGIAALAANEAAMAARWVEMLPAEAVHSSPDHCVLGAWAYSLMERHDRVIGYAERARELTESGTRPYPFVEGVDAHADIIWAGTQHLKGEPPPYVFDLLDAVRSRLSPEDALLHSTVEIMTGNVMSLSGRYGEAASAYARSFDFGTAAASELMTAAAAGSRAQALLMQGDLGHAGRCCRSALDALRSGPPPEAASPNEPGPLSRIDARVGVLHALLAFVQYEQNDIGEAEANLGLAWEAMGLRQGFGVEGLNLSYYVTARPSAFHSSAPGICLTLLALARLLVHQGRGGEAARLVDDLEHQVTGAHPSIWRVAVDAVKVRAWTGRGDTARLGHWLEVVSPVGTGSRFWDEAAHCARVRACVGVADYGRATREAESALSVWRGSSAPIHLVEMLLLAARAHHGASAPAAAARCVDEALEVSARCGLVRTWLDEGGPLLELLQLAVGQATGSPSASAHAVELVGLLQREASVGSPDPRAELSDREREVLRLIAAGHTNGEIGERLFLAVGTVKKHSHSIYQKLGVSSRTQAVRKAQELHLLQDP